MFCALSDLKTESDVEQKLLLPLLTTPSPSGLNLKPADFVTKLSIRRLEIGKGENRKLYFPDYVVVIAGLPLLVIEAKNRGEDLQAALDEARLYANEVNAQFPTGVNPCVRVVACNGDRLISSPVDTTSVDIECPHSQMSSSHASFAQLLEACGRDRLQRHADDMRKRFSRSSDYRRAVARLGGATFQNEELPSNTFGATISGDYGHVFNPRSRADRERVARHAYIKSIRRQRYIEPIDRLIRGAVAPATADLRTFEDTGKPLELATALRERRRLENQVMLLVGSVGSGKSTFLDYVSLVALPEDVRSRSVWVRLDLNDAPLATAVAYSWLARAVTEGLREHVAEDIDELPVLQKILRPELSTFSKGPLALLDPESIEYKTRLADELSRLQRDDVRFAQCLARYVCAGPGKLLIIALDNCDKRTRDEQLTMFQVAQWVRTEFKALVVLPLRDVTFERHRHEPPLDTALKGLVFRIEPPQFTDVLQARVRLALEEMQANAPTANTLSYVLPNGMRVSYPASDQALYLASILRSLYEHDRFVRRVMTGLAGRDVRRALEIFLDFCTSGYIGEDEIYKIRFSEGHHVLPLSVVARVLLRMQRRFYDGDKAYIKNLVQCVPADAQPDHFVRLSIVKWLEQHHAVVGPAGVQGFHKIERIVRDLAQLGHDAVRTRTELLYLVREGCAVAEHLRLDEVTDDDLVKLTASGLVHLQLMANPDYLAACAEDTFVSDVALADRVADRIASRGLAGHVSKLTTAKNASEFVTYLRAKATDALRAPETYLDFGTLVQVMPLREAEAAVGAAEIEVSTELYVGNLPYDATDAMVKTALSAAGIEVISLTLPRGLAGNVNRGFAFFEVADGATALKALDASELRIGERRLRIGEAHGPRPSGQARRSPNLSLSERLYLGNLPRTVTEQAIRDMFINHGFKPLDVYIGSNRGVPTAAAYAFVSVASQDEATTAIGAINGTAFEGRSIVVKPAAPRLQ